MPPSSSEVSIGSRQYAHGPVGDTGAMLQFEQVTGAALMHTRTAVKIANTATAFMTPNSVNIRITYFSCSS